LDTKPPEVLKINTKELQARLAAENFKLRKMLDYSYHQKCLRSFILTYFGERKHLGNCGACSNCAPRESIFDSKKGGTLSLLTTKQNQFKMDEVTNLKSQKDNIATSASIAIPRTATEQDKQLIDNAPKGLALRNKLRTQSEMNRLEAVRSVPEPN